MSDNKTAEKKTVQTEEKAKRCNIATTLTPEQFERFEEVAWQRKHRRNADAIREAVDEWLEKYGTVGSGASPVAAG